MAEPVAKPSPITLPKKPVRSLGMGKLKSAVLAHPILFCTVPNDVTFDEVMTPAFWQNHVVSFQTNPYGEVTVVREDMSMILKLMAIEAKVGMVRMHVLSSYVNDSNQRAGTEKASTDLEGLELPPGYKYAYVVGKLGHMVRLGNVNGTVVVEGAVSKADAIRKAIAHANIANTPSNAGVTPAPGELPRVPADA